MKKLFLFTVILLSIISCRKSKKITNTEPSGPEYAWSRYIGTYDVYDTASHFQWVMKITHLYHSDFNNGNNDSVLIENFDNQFTIRDTWHPVFFSGTKLPGFFLKGYNPIADKSNFRWSLNTKGTETTDTKIENALQNDTIIINFQISNIAWYALDGIPYYSCMDCKHIAVKRH